MYRNHSRLRRGELQLWIIFPRLMRAEAFREGHHIWTQPRIHMKHLSMFHEEIQIFPRTSWHPSRSHSQRKMTSRANEMRLMKDSGVTSNIGNCQKTYVAPSTWPTWKRSIPISTTDWDSSMKRYTFSHQYFIIGCHSTSKSIMRRRGRNWNRN